MSDKYQKKHGDFTLFVNDRKEKDSHPDRSGSIFLKDEDGVLREYWFKGWLKEGKNGKFLSGCIGDEKVAKR